MKILQISPFFSPNLGGVETHLDDLVKELSVNKIFSEVITYQPVMSKLNAPRLENKGVYIKIHRLNILRNLFLKLEPYPLADFLFLFPKLFIYSFYFCLRNKDIDVIHCHGLISGLIGKILKFFFNKPLVVSTHATYDLKNNLSLGKKFKFILSSADKILTLSQASKDELIFSGLDENKIEVYRYWVDQEVFKIRNRNFAKKEVGFSKNKLCVLFVGRLIEKKGVFELLKAIELFKDKNFEFKIAGPGPLEDTVKEFCQKNNSTEYLGIISNDKTSLYYNASDILIVPSTHDEGFGRVILEALSSGVPVIASNRGGIKEAIDNEVGILVDVTPENIIDSLQKIKTKIETLGAESLSHRCRKFAKKNYSRDNIQVFLKTYAEIRNQK